jgi:signal transduction histidine kinase/CheY-like chemotaxis protein/HAMP domain-containing protein
MDNKKKKGLRISFALVIVLVMAMLLFLALFQNEIAEVISGANSQIVNVVLLVGALLLALIQFRRTSRRLEDLSEVADQIGRGNYQARSDDPGTDSVGNLARSVNLMAEKISTSIEEIEDSRKKLEIQSSKLERQNRALSQAVDQQERFGEYLKRIASIEVNIIGQEALSFLMRVSQAQIGLFYSYDDQKDELVLLHNRSVDANFLENFTAGNPLEGLPGEVIRRKDWITLEDIDPEALPDINLGFSRAKIRNMFAIPVIYQNRVLGVVVLAGLSKVDDSLRRALSNQVEALANAMINAQNYRASQKQAIQLEDANRELLAAHKQKSEFVANMSHELRTPLNSIIGFSGILMKNRKGNLSDSDLQRVEKINRNGRHLLSLINDILDLSKIEAGRMDTIIENTDVTGVIHDVAEMLQPQAEGKDLILKTEIPATSVHLNTDGHKLKQVLINLAANAIKFTKEGSVTIRLQVVDESINRVRLEVIDTGIGIPQDKLDTIFEAFTQADASTTREYGGTGLGLAISKSIIELLGGHLTVQSEIGVGSNFIIDLKESGSKAPFGSISGASQAPFKMSRHEGEAEASVDVEEMAERNAERLTSTPSALPDGSPPAPDKPSGLGANASNGQEEKKGTHPPAEGRPKERQSLPRLKPGSTPPTSIDGKQKAAPGTPDSRPPLEQLTHKGSTKDDLRKILPIEAGKRVLIIDDDPDAREFLGRYIEDLGAGYRECDNGFKAVDMIRDYKPDLITLDISMPGINGWDTLALIKKESDINTIPVIIVSILADKRKAQALGAVDALAKPVAQRDFLEACRRQLNETELKDRKVLVVDDMPEFRQLMKVWLDQESNEIRTASNGREALEILETFVPDIIFLDLMMPVMDGMGFLKEFRSREKFAHIPVVVVTAKSLSRTERSWLQNRADKIMQKGEDING